MTDLGTLAAAVSAHLDELGVERSDWVRVGKVAEEGGEVIGALIKRTQGRATTADVEDELADVILAALGAIDQLGVDPTALVARRWAEVSVRTRDTLTRTSAAAEAQSSSAEGTQMNEYSYGVEPTQLDGMKAGGQPFYFRARHGRWDLWLGPVGAAPNYLSWWEKATLVAEGDDPTEGAMLPRQVDAIVAEHLGPGWAAFSTNPAEATYGAVGGAGGQATSADGSARHLTAVPALPDDAGTDPAETKHDVPRDL